MSAQVVSEQLCLKSQPANITLIEPFVEELRQRLHIADELYGNMLVCLTEAVNNAIWHGNQADPHKEVTIVIRAERHSLCCCVRDQGKGFDYNNLPDPTSPEHIEEIGGRGVFLMKQLSDMVIFSNDGSSVEIQFKWWKRNKEWGMRNEE